jgi:transposase InsO family protein
MRRVGFRVNPKRIARLCRDGKLLLERRKGRKRVAVERTPRVVPTGPNSGVAWTSCLIAWPTGGRSGC